MMVNTKIITHEFDYLEPKSLDEALRLLNKYGEQARILAGGTDLLLQVKQERLLPRYLIDISKVKELARIEEKGGLRIGAVAKLADVREYCSRQPKHVALFEAISVLGKPQVWNMGTVGGNLCNASPAADTGPPILVYGGRVKLVSESREREILVQDFFTGVNQTVLEQGEILAEIVLEPIPDDSGSAFKKMARVGADISKISCAVYVERDGNRCSLCRIALGAVAPVPMRTRGAEDLVTGKEVDEALLQRAGLRVAEEIGPIDDIRSTAEYRREVSAVLFRDVFSKAWQRAGGQVS
ncbi:MAG: xanthine dehydrogenase family protein subunit M [Deltaproteobacteria bacterium]|nr:xanthine dehydrogenase family protein subunit M [Deltaproteobacteria bacterium]